MIEFTIYAKLESINVEMRKHWAPRKKRNELINMVIKNQISKHELQLPCVVKMIRLGKRKLDDDNLQGAFKSVRDYIAECLTGKSKGRGDSDPRIKWQYDQESYKREAFKIVILPL